MQLSTPICFPSTKPPQLPALPLLPRPSPRLASASGPGSAALRLGLPPPPSVVSAMRRRGRRRATPPPGAAAGGGGEAAAPDSQEKRAGTDIKTLATRFWKVAAPYWWSEDKTQARLRLAAVFALTLGTTGISVGFNFLGRDFYNALADKDQEKFTQQLLYYLGAFAGGIPNLVNLNFMQEKKEADFRYGLVRVRENAESIAFYGGEENELKLLLDRFRRAFDNLSELLIASRNLEFFTSGYRYLIQILPAAVVAPMYFSGKIEFGVINQSVSAFNHILSDFSLIVFQFQSISAFSAVIDRLGEFDDLLDGNESSLSSQNDSVDDINIIFKSRSSVVSSNGSLTQSDPCMVLEILNLTLITPRSGNVLITDLNLELKDKDHLLVMGPSGSGKTSLLRALAGLWTSGTGDIIYHVRGSMQFENSNVSSDEPSNMKLEGEEVLQSSKQRRDNGIFFVPQRPYMVLGTLRQQLLYPTWSEDVHHSPNNDAESTDPLPFLSEVSTSEGVGAKPEMPSTAELVRVLEVVRLGYILPRFNGLDSMHDWASVLSLGEQQRLAFARLLLAKPTLVLLDESTSALDEANEAHLYSQIEAAGITYISVGHRKTLHKFHNKALYISKSELTDSNLRNWELKPTSQISVEESSPFSS
nr:ABC transporter D family member 2, chloroplastic isoform X2 [Setaria viridis]